MRGRILSQQENILSSCTSNDLQPRHCSGATVPIRDAANDANAGAGCFQNSRIRADPYEAEKALPGSALEDSGAKTLPSAIIPHFHIAPLARLGAQPGLQPNLLAYFPGHMPLQHRRLYGVAPGPNSRLICRLLSRFPSTTESQLAQAQASDPMGLDVPHSDDPKEYSVTDVI